MGRLEDLEKVRGWVWVGEFQAGGLWLANGTTRCSIMHRWEERKGWCYRTVGEFYGTVAFRRAGLGARALIRDERRRLRRMGLEPGG